MTEQLLRDLIAGNEEFVECLYRDLDTCKAHGDFEGAFATVQTMRQVKSVIRKGRKVLLAVIGAGL